MRRASWSEPIPAGSSASASPGGGRMQEIKELVNATLERKRVLARLRVRKEGTGSPPKNRRPALDRQALTCCPPTWRCRQSSGLRSSSPSMSRSRAPAGSVGWGVLGACSFACAHRVYAHGRVRGEAQQPMVFMSTHPVQLPLPRETPARWHPQRWARRATPPSASRCSRARRVGRGGGGGARVNTCVCVCGTGGKAGDECMAVVRLRRGGGGWGGGHGGDTGEPPWPCTLGAPARCRDHLWGQWLLLTVMLDGPCLRRPATAGACQGAADMERPGILKPGAHHAKRAGARSWACTFNGGVRDRGHACSWVVACVGVLCAHV